MFVVLVDKMVQSGLCQSNVELFTSKVTAKTIESMSANNYMEGSGYVTMK